MPIVTIRDLYVIDLTELYHAECQILCELPLLSAAATADDLRDAFDEHYRRTLTHIDRLEHIFRELDERPRGGSSRSLRAVVEDARTRHALLDRGPALDAALIALARRMAHGEIGAYSSACTYARRLAGNRGGGLLEETLNEEERMAERLTALAAAGAAGAGRVSHVGIVEPVPATGLETPLVDGANGPGLVPPRAVITSH
jgi:ferritin-like metal-binding protein YciE